MQEDGARLPGRIERLGYFGERHNLLGVHGQIARGQELLVRVGIARDRSLLQFHQPAFYQGPQRLVVERRLAQQISRRHRSGKLSDGLEQLRLARRAPAQLLHFFGRQTGARMNKHLLFPSHLGFAHDLRKQAANDRLNGATVIGAHPLTQLQQVGAERRRFADDGFDFAQTPGIAVFEQPDHRGQGGFVAKRHAQTRTHGDAAGQRFRDGIIELAVNGAINDHADKPTLGRVEHAGI